MKDFYQIHEKEFNITHHRRAIIFPPHMHNEIELFYIFGGSQIIGIDGEISLMQSGGCAVIFPNVTHEYIRPKDDGEMKSTMLFLPSRMLYGAFPQFAGRQPRSGILAPSEISDDARLALEKIAVETLPAARDGWARIILAHIIPRFETDKIGASSDPDSVSRLMNYISANFRSSITLEILSEALGMSKSQISRIFSDKIHIGLRSYVGILRSEYAAELIQTSSDPLSEIAARAGFESLRTCNRVFREVYGLTPSEFKKSIQAQPEND